MRAVAVLACGAMLAGSGGARAASVQRTVPGQALGVDLACFRQLRIQPSASLRGAFQVTATADHEEELARLLIGAAGGAVVRMRPGPCWRPAGAFRPTLDVAIDVPVATPIALGASGAGETTIGAVGGRIKAELSGAGGLRAERAEGLTLDLSGTPTVSIGSVGGGATIDGSGHAQVSIDRIDVARLSIDQSGTGAIVVSGGRIGSANVQSEGAGTVRLLAATGDATAEASGASRVTFATVTGRFEHDASGMATVAIER